jgi:hypothetical protein
MSIEDPDDEPLAVAVETWYDRQTRSWITYLVDAEGHQLGAAAYDGTRADRDASIRHLELRIAVVVE